MLLALLSDTHDNTASTQAALDLLAPHKPDAYLHAGDLVAPDMLTLFAGLPFHFVFGNNEYDLPAIRSMAHALDLHCHEYSAILTFAGKRIALLHGHDTSLMAKLLKPHRDPAQNIDYLIHGHTHVRRDERISPITRILNPGALYRSKSKSVALLNPETDVVTFLSLPAS